MYIGLADFAEPTLLVLGDVASLNWLADGIEMRRPIDLATSPFVKLVNVGLVIAPTNEEGNLCRNDTQFKWQISPMEAQQFAKQLRALAGSESSAHAYLDPKTNTAGVQLIASLGEYSGDDAFIHKKPPTAPQ